MFQKNSSGKKIEISGISKLGSFGNEFGHSILPPLTDSSPFNGETKRPIQSANNVPCFSTAMDSQRKLEPMVSPFNDNNTPSFSVIPNPNDPFPRNPHSNSVYSAPIQGLSVPPNLQFPGSVLLQEQQSLLRALLQNVNGGNARESREKKISVSQEACLTNDANNEISSVFANLEMGRRPFQNSQEAPLAPMAPPIDLDSFWNY